MLNCDWSVDATGVLSCLLLAHTLRRWSNDRSDSFNRSWTDSIFESVQQLSRCRVNERRLSATRSHCAIIRLSLSLRPTRQKSRSVSRALVFEGSGSVKASANQKRVGRARHRRQFAAVPHYGLSLRQPICANYLRRPLGAGEMVAICCELPAEPSVRLSVVRLRRSALSWQHGPGRPSQT